MSAAADVQSATTPGAARGYTDSVSPACSVRLRTGRSADAAFVHTTWRRYYRRHNESVQRVPELVYAAEQRIAIDAILSRSALLVVCDASDADVIAGYVVAEGPSLHWIHVKDGLRGYGLARMLVSALAGPLLWYTHETQDAASLWPRLGLALQYNPYRAWAP